MPYRKPSILYRIPYILYRWLDRRTSKRELGKRSSRHSRALQTLQLLYDARAVPPSSKCRGSLLTLRDTHRKTFIRYALGVASL